MNVANLQAYLANLGSCLLASGAKTAAADLEAISEGLQPFRDQPLKGFADFLLRAEAYSRGEVPLTGKGGRASGGAKRAPASSRPAATDVGQVSKAVHDLYERMSDPHVTPEQVEAVLRPLDSLKKEDLLVVAKGIDLTVPKSKTKDQIIDGIRQRLAARQASAQRAGLIDRPASATPKPGPSTTIPVATALPTGSATPGSPAMASPAGSGHHPHDAGMR